MRYLLVLLLLALLPPAQAAPTLLRAEVATLYYGSQPVRLVGTNLDNIGSASAGIGSGRASDSPYTLPDYRLIRSHGANHVRLGLWYGWYTRDKAGFYRYVDTQLGYARTADLWVVLLLFSTPGDCYEGYGNSCGIWGSGAEQTALVTFWREVATRYAADPVVAGYDILNEPTPPNDCKQWFPIAGRVVTAIRDVSQQLVFVETCSDPGNDLRWNSPPRGANLVYEVHDYSPMGMSHNFAGSTYPGYANEWYGRCYFEAATFTGGNNCPQADLRESHGVNWAREQNVPLYIGEWGATSKLSGDEQYTTDKGTLYRQWGISHAHYTWWHQTIKTGGYYQWGISSSTGAVDDAPKLAAVADTWRGEYQPNFGQAPPPPPADTTHTPTTSPGATETPRPTTEATTSPATATRTLGPTAIARRTATAQARQTATQAARQTATAVPATAQPAGALGVTLAADATLITVPVAGGVLISTYPEMPAGAVLPAGCDGQGMSVWCWGAQPGVLRLPWAAETVAARQGRSVVVVAR